VCLSFDSFKGHSQPLPRVAHSKTEVDHRGSDTMKIRSKRTRHISGKWQKLVFRMYEIEPTKENKKQLRQLWFDGYSHKDAAYELKQERANT